jgi:Cu(I)/Ag(I) efflux system membrane protein CusA/SilA
MGPDLAVLSDLGAEIEAVMRTVPGTLSAIAERTVGGYYLDFEINRLAAARYGIQVGDIQDVIQTAAGGMMVTQTVEGLERYPVSLRYDRDFRSDLPALKRMLVPAPNGAHIPMEQLAKITVRNAPDSIKSENARRTAWVYVDIKGIDVGTYVKNAQRTVAEKVKLPAGYNIVRAAVRVHGKGQVSADGHHPLTVLIIFVIIYITREPGQDGDRLLVVPFSLVGAFWFMYALDYDTP